MSLGLLQVFVELGNLHGTSNYIKDIAQSSGKVPEFGKHLKKAGGYIGRNVVQLTIKMKTIVRKPLMIKIMKLRLRNLDNYIYIYIYICYKKKKTERKILINVWDLLIDICDSPSTCFDENKWNYLRYEIRKFQVDVILDHLQGGNYEFKITL